jgi:hypothetical protein
MSKYDLKNKKDRRRFFNRVRQLIKYDAVVELTVTDKKKKDGKI